MTCSNFQPFSYLHNLVGKKYFSDNLQTLKTTFNTANYEKT